MARTRILLVGEGPQDIGTGPRAASEARARDAAEEGDEYLGALGILVPRVIQATRGAPPEALDLERRSIKHVHKHGEGIRGKVRGTMVQAGLEGFQAVVIVVDRDGDTARSRDMAKGREEARLAGEAIPTALGCAVEALEAWLLADPRAVTSALEVPVEDIPSHPESLSGRRGSGHHPKDRLKALVASSPRGLDAGHAYCEIARSADLETISSACPKGFRPFRDDVAREVLQPGL